MPTKFLIFLGMSIGSVAGGYVPMLWGGSLFSYSSVILSGVGGILGVIVAYKLSS